MLFSPFIQVLAPFHLNSTLETMLKYLTNMRVYCISYFALLVKEHLLKSFRSSDVFVLNQNGDGW